jgi:murein L,D-transpeptidase YafK
VYHNGHSSVGGVVPESFMYALTLPMTQSFVTNLVATMTPLSPVLRWLGCASLAVLSGCMWRQQPQFVEPAPVVQMEAERTDPWILIDGRSKRMTVYRKSGPPVVFEGVAFGAAGVKEKRRAGDDTTPRGTYTVGWIRKQSKFVHFIGLTYPSLEDAERGYQNGVISHRTFERIKRAIEQGRVPPQDTALGGFIGIHGVGRGSLSIHRVANWTAGCVAVDNKQIRELSALIRPGIQVEIR